MLFWRREKTWESIKRLNFPNTIQLIKIKFGLHHKITSNVFCVFFRNRWYSADGDYESLCLKKIRFGSMGVFIEKAVGHRIMDPWSSERMQTKTKSETMPILYSIRNSTPWKYAIVWPKNASGYHTRSLDLDQR